MRGLLVRKLVITLFCVALLIPSRGNTLGLGEIELHSSLNQELSAEIELKSIGKESAETIIVKLASKAEFTRAGLDRPFILNDLKFVVKVKNGQPYISVTSKKTIREPYLSFLLDIDWPRGRILREFTMLLDPPVFMQATPDGVPSKTIVAPPQAVNEVNDVNQQYNRPAYDGSNNTNSQAVAPSAAVANTQSQAQNQAQTQQNFNQPATQSTARSVARYQAATNGYRVQKNDTAWKIAERLRTDPSISIEQMMMALLRRNPEAFIKDNINGVKRGYILRMPEQQEIDNLGQQTALLQVKEQYALWREYRQGLTAKRNANKIARGTSTDPKPDSAVKGHLTIASAAEGEASDGVTSGRQNPDAELKQLRQDLSATTEELESGKLENNDLKDRINSLKTRMKKMEKLLNLKDSDLANLQSDIAPESAKPVADAMAKEDIAEVTPAAVDMAPEAALATDVDVEPEMSLDGSMGLPTDASMDAISSTQPAEDAVFKDEMSESSMEPVAKAPAPVIPPMQPVEVGDVDPLVFIEELLKDPDNLPYIAGVPAVIVLLLLVLVIRRKKAKAAADEPVTALPETGDFNFDGIDLADDSDDSFNASEEEDLGAQLEAFAEEAESNDVEDVISLEDGPSEDEIPKDDVLAEADVYLAYGIYQQAEELLKTAITNNPDREDYKVKLLETYFAAKDKANFVSRAEEIKPALNQDSPEWLRIVAMGRELDAANEMFRQDGELKGFDVDDMIPEKPETDFDLGDAAADFDLGDSLEDDGFGHGLDDESLDDDIEATVAMSSDELSDLDFGGLDSEGSDNFALNDDGMDELDQELAAAESNISLEDSSSSSEPEEVEDDAFSLDFEMADLGLDEAAAEVSLEETEVVATAMEPEIDNTEFNLSDDLLEMDLDDLPAGLESETADTADEISLDMGDIDLGGIDLAADDDVSLDIGEIDLTMDLDDASDDFGLDLGEVDLSTDDDSTVLRSTQEEDDEAIDISTLPDDLDEVNTKLDLAKAYIDMGDSDGAASILREVIDEGAGTQKQAAEELLKNIA